MDQKKAFTAMDSTLQAFVSILLRFLVVGLAVTRLLYLFAYGVNDFASAGICVAIFLLIEFFCRRLDFNFTKINLLLIIVASIYSFSFLLEPGRNIVWFFIAFFVCLLFSKLLELGPNKHCNIAASFTAIFFALFIFIGYQLKFCGRFEFIYANSWEEFRLHECFLYLFRFIGLFSFFYAVLRILFSYVSDDENISKSHNFPPFAHPFRRFCLYSLLFMALWLPIFIAYYPGIYHPDSFGSISEQLGDSALSNHNPIIYQLLIGFCLSIGRAMQSMRFGLGLYSLIQMLIQAMTFADVIVYMQKRRFAPALIWSLVVLFAINVVISFYSVYMVKDVIFGAITLLLVLALTEEVNQIRENRDVKRGSLPGLIILAFLFSVWRNNGMYAFLFGFLLFSLINRKRWKRYLVTLVAVLLLIAGYKYLIFNILEAEKSRTAEALSVPLQQIARTMKLYGEEELSSDEVQILREVFPEIEGLGSLYKSHISDPVKAIGVFESEVFDGDPARYANAWMKLGLRHPRTYIDAFLLQCYGYFYPDLDVGGILEYLPNYYLDEPWSEQFSALRSRVYNTYGSFTSLQPTAIFYSIGFAGWVLLFSAGVYYVKGIGRLASPLLLLLGYWLTLLLSPVFCEFRYAYCLVLCAPVSLALSLGERSEQEKVNTVVEHSA